MMTMGRLAVAATFTAAALVAPAAEACTPLPTPYATLVDGLPAARVGLPRDGGVVVRGKLWGPSGGPYQFAQVRLLDAAGVEIPSVEETWYSAEPSLAVRPAVPLPPRTRFAVEALVPPGPPLPSPGAAGSQTLRLEFETGAELATTMALAGPLRVSLEPYEVPAETCSTPAVGCAAMVPCQKLPARRALRARIVVPAASGGVDFDGYRGWLRFTDDKAGTFGPGAAGVQWSGLVNVRHWIDVRPGVQTEILQDIIEEDGAYAPCFALQLWDPAGHAVEAQSLCLPSIKASEYLRELDRGPDATAGCRTLPGNNRAPGSLVMIALAAAALVARRHRSRR
jgi:hypothetical protein